MPDASERLEKRLYAARLLSATEADRAIRDIRLEWGRRVGRRLADRVLLALMLDFAVPGVLEEIARKTQHETSIRGMCSCGAAATESLYVQERHTVIDTCERCARAAIL